MMKSADENNSFSGTARLWIVAPAVLMSFFYLIFLEYFLPLYFGALETQAKATGSHFPTDMWSQYQKYLVSVWIICPFIAGLLSRRYGERYFWSFAQLAVIPITVLLIYSPIPSIVLVAALWTGATSTFVWAGGISLVQLVPSEKKGLSNTVMMVGLGVGSLLAPICGRAGGRAGALMIAGFAVGAWGIGFSSVAWQLFFWIGVLEFARQFIRWAQAGYISEHLPNDLRSTAIGCSVAISGLAGTIYAWVADYFWSPGISDSYPFYAASICGMIGCVGLFIFDWLYPINQSLLEDVAAFEKEAALNEGSVAEA